MSRPKASSGRSATISSKRGKAVFAPEVRVALHEYGNARLSRESGWFQQVVPLTTGLGKISEELFAQRTSCGEEYCWLVFQGTVEDLACDPATNVYKAIFIAGNEPFTQEPVHYAEACKAAITEGTVINTINCANET